MSATLKRSAGAGVALVLFLLIVGLPVWALSYGLARHDERVKQCLASSCATPAARAEYSVELMGCVCVERLQP